MMRFDQIEAQWLSRTEGWTHQLEDALSQALQTVQEVKAEQSKVLREVRAFVGELMQATGLLFRQRPGAMPSPGEAEGAH